VLVLVLGVAGVLLDPDVLDDELEESFEEPAATVEEEPERLSVR
jgi:hypothetical protein